MKTIWRMRAAVVVAMALALAAGCAARGGGGNPPPPPPPPVEHVQVNFLVHDFVAPDQRIADAIVTCPEAAGSTDGAGLVSLSLRNVWQECTIGKAGYHDTRIGVTPGLNDPEAASLTKDTPPPPPHPVSRNARQGFLRVQGDGFHDDSGPVNPLWAHAGNLFSLFVRDEARALQELDDVAAAGYQGIRVWGVLGCGPNTAAGCTHGAFWKDREVGPDITPDYWGKVQRFADALRARGLRAVWSQGDIGQLRNRRDYMRALAALDVATPFIDVIDCGNEAWQTGEPDPARLAECVSHYQNAGGRALLTLTSPPGELKDELDRYSIPPAQLYDVHSWRDGHWYDKRRHIFSIAYEQKPRLPFGIGSEPPGNGDRVSASANKHELDNEAVPMLAVTSMLARQSFVWFSGEGVIIDRGLKTEAGFWTTPTAVELLPRNVMAYPLLFHSGTSWSHARIVAAADETRVDCRSNGVDFACTIDGPSQDGQRLDVVRGFTGKLCDPGTMPATCSDVTRAAGEQLAVTFRRGRVLVGRVQ
ncbi:MAG: hypothetical protein AB7S57_19575 [Acetobacteraceae bacterium]